MSDAISDELESLRKSNREIARRVVEFFGRVDRLEDVMSFERRETLGLLESFAHEVDTTRKERALFDLSFNTLHERLLRLEKAGGIHGTRTD
jgi:hypothetical protein